MPKFTDKVRTITLKINNEIIEIRQQSEQDMPADLMSEIAKIDPDFIFTTDGDEFVLPYLIARAAKNNMQLVFDHKGMPVN